MSYADIANARLRRLPPEAAHNAALALLRLGRPPVPPPSNPALAMTLWGLRFPTPVGLAAGFDKDARCPDAAARLGPGFGEAGTVTPLPQPGNPRSDGMACRLKASHQVIKKCMTCTQA